MLLPFLWAGCSFPPRNIATTSAAPVYQEIPQRLRVGSLLPLRLLHRGWWHDGGGALPRPDPQMAADKALPELPPQWL